MASRASLNTMKKICTLKTSVMAAMCSAGLPGFVLCAFCLGNEEKTKGSEREQDGKRRPTTEYLSVSEPTDEKLLVVRKERD